MEVKPLVRKPLTIAGILNRPELLLGIAGILTIIGAFGTWASWEAVARSGWDTIAGKVTVTAGLIMLYSTAVRLGYITVLKDVVPVLCVSAVCGLLLLIGALAVLTGVGHIIEGGGWGLYLTIVAGLVALFAAYRALVLERGRF